mmetsp:Transcript_5124/g.14315  ORF Transcript_5124/g.14315 Transcript_5124/m.14315 type:complete len:750 (-) Transcript_5124:147-2396(-)
MVVVTLYRVGKRPFVRQLLEPFVLLFQLFFLTVGVSLLLVNRFAGHAAIEHQKQSAVLLDRFYTSQGLAAADQAAATADFAEGSRDEVASETARAEEAEDRERETAAAEKESQFEAEAADDRASADAAHVQQGSDEAATAESQAEAETEQSTAETEAAVAEADEAEAAADASVAEEEEAGAEAEEASEAVLTFIPLIDIVADTAGTAVAIALQAAAVLEAASATAATAESVAAWSAEAAAESAAAAAEAAAEEAESAAAEEAALADEKEASAAEAQAGSEEEKEEIERDEELAEKAEADADANDADEAEKDALGEEEEDAAADEETNAAKILVELVAEMGLAIALSVVAFVAAFLPTLYLCCRRLGSFASVVCNGCVSCVFHRGSLNSPVDRTVVEFVEMSYSQMVYESVDEYQLRVENMKKMRRLSDRMFMAMPYLIVCCTVVPAAAHSVRIIGEQAMLLGDFSQTHVSLHVMAENFTKLLAVIIPQLRHCLVWTLIANAVILPTALVADLEKNRRWHDGNPLRPRLIHMLFAVVEPVQQGMLSSVVVTVVLLSWSRTLWGMWKPFNTSWRPHEGDMQIVGVVLLCAFVAVQVYIRIRYKPQRVMYNSNYISRAPTWDHRALRYCEKCWGLTRNLLLLPLRFLVNVVDVPFTILCSGIALNTYVFMAKFSSFAWPWVKQTAYQKAHALPGAGKLFLYSYSWWFIAVSAVILVDALGWIVSDCYFRSSRDTGVKEPLLQASSKTTDCAA